MSQTQALIAECEEAIDTMHRKNFITAKQAALLQEATLTDPDLGRWFVATIGHHAEAELIPSLSDDMFAGLCLMSIHRYQAAAEGMNSPIVTRAFNTLSDFGPGNGIPVAIANYLTRTPIAVGEALIESLRINDNAKEKIAALTSPVEIFRHRARVETSYIERLLVEDKTTVKAHIQQGRSLNSLIS